MIRYIPGLEGRLSGYLSADPEMRFTGEGKPVTEIRICLNGKRIEDADKNPIKDDKGFPLRPQQWFKIALFESLAEKANKLLSKQSFVELHGYQSLRGWIDKNGNQRDDFGWVCSGVKYLRNNELTWILPDDIPLVEEAIKAGAVVETVTTNKKTKKEEPVPDDIPF